MDQGTIQGDVYFVKKDFKLKKKNSTTGDIVPIACIPDDNHGKTLIATTENQNDNKLSPISNSVHYQKGC